MKITEKIKSFEDACEALSINSALPNLEAIPESYQKPILAHYKLCVIAEALNEGWKPNWDDYNEYKYYPWFDMQDASSGSEFSYYDYDNWNTNSNVSSRNCKKIKTSQTIPLGKKQKIFKGVGNKCEHDFIKSKGYEKNRKLISASYQYREFKFSRC